jgi:hypothetical protein
MAANLDLLVAEFKAKVQQLIARCEGRGVTMRPYDGLRDPFSQARLWRQSRSIEEIKAKIAALESESAPFLADCLRRVGPQNGDPVTNTAPGISWHQWGEALDCFWLVDGAAEWSLRRMVDGQNGYHVYADEAEKLGLTPGGHWPRFKDWPHVQLRDADNAESVMSFAQIDAAMKARFGP